jgi:hypothetical protein
MNKDNYRFATDQSVDRFERRWQTAVDWARLRPAMFIGDQVTAHTFAVRCAYALVASAHAFRGEGAVAVHLSPHQYVVQCRTGVLRPEIERCFTWSDTSYILDERWQDENERFRRERRRATTNQLKYMVTWKSCFAGPYGPTLDSPMHAAVLAKRLVVAYRVSDGYWCQGFRDRWPESCPFRRFSESQFGLITIADLDPVWFTGLPFTKEHVYRLENYLETEVHWHDEDDLVMPALSADQELDRWW